MNEGRAEAAGTTVKTPITLAGPLDEVVIRIGLASMVLGSILTLLANATRPGRGAFDAVPEALTGLAAICLGWFAVVLAHPSWGGPRPGRLGWLFVGSGLLATVAVVIVALDDLGGPAVVAPSLARMMVSLGLAVIVGGLTWLFVVLVLAGFGFVWRQILAAGAERWIR